MFKWYVVQVFTAQEKRVKQAIEEQKERCGVSEFIQTVLLPTEYVSEVKQGQQKILEKKLWPGYLLVKMDLNDETWGFIKELPAVIDFLGGGKPTALTDEEVDHMLKDLEEKKTTVSQKHRFAPGDNVKIIEGVFVNFVGTVTDVFHDKGRLSVLVSIFGRDTKVEDLEFTQVEHIAEDAIPEA